MKKTIFTSIAFLVFVHSFATIRRLNNNPGVSLVPNLVYSDFVTAVNESSTGDTIYVEPSITPYTITPSTLDLTKKLTFIGNGYNIGNNAGLINPLPFQTTESIIGSGNMNINAGAQNSEFYGITFSQNNFIVNTSNVKFDRCKFNVSLVVNGSNNIVQRSIFAGSSGINIGGASATSLNNIFTNCIIQNLYGQFSGIFDRCYINSINNFSPAIGNCVFTNSIINAFPAAPSLTNTFTNCIRIGGTFPNAGINNNIENVDMSNVFIVANPFGALPLLDRSFRLSATSPAIGTGIAGSDIGPFGGPNPYRLSGQPAVPVITNFFLSTTGSTASGLSGSITIQANN